MPLRTTISDREWDKFQEVDGQTTVRVTGQNFSGSFSVSGLNVAGRVTEVSINSSTWTALPASPLANRNAIAIQNNSGQTIKINYDNGVAGFVGMSITDQQERFYDITDAIVQYAKCTSGTVTISIEELS